MRKVLVRVLMALVALARESEGDEDYLSKYERLGGSQCGGSLLSQWSNFLDGGYIPAANMVCSFKVVRPLSNCASPTLAVSFTVVGTVLESPLISQLFEKSTLHMAIDPGTTLSVASETFAAITWKVLDEVSVVPAKPMTPAVEKSWATVGSGISVVGSKRKSSGLTREVTSTDPL